MIKRKKNYIEHTNWFKPRQQQSKYFPKHCCWSWASERFRVFLFKPPSFQKVFVRCGVCVCLFKVFLRFDISVDFAFLHLFDLGCSLLYAENHSLIAHSTHSFSFLFYYLFRLFYFCSFYSGVFGV